MKNRDPNPLVAYNQLFIIIGIISLSALLASFLAVNVFSLELCDLCLYQRYTYLAILMASFIGILFRNKRALSYALIFLTGFGIYLSAYHVLIQYEIVNDFCILSKQTSNIEQFKIQIFNKNNLSCSKITWRFLHLPVSAWNLLIFLISFAFVVARASKLFLFNLSNSNSKINTSDLRGFDARLF
jgi:disulfide bond formation protein DsbB